MTAKGCNVLFLPIHNTGRRNKRAGVKAGEGAFGQGCAERRDARCREPER